MTQSTVSPRSFAVGLLRRLLQVDAPAFVRSDEDVEAEAWQNYNWNFAVNLTDGATFWLGQSFISVTTALPLFVSKLTDNPFFIGVLAVIVQAGWYFPQLLTAGLIEQTARKKPWVINLGFFIERLPIILLPLAAVLAVRAPAWALTFFLLTLALHTIGAGIIAPAWQDLIAACFPTARRGRLMGATMCVGAVAGALGAIASGWILDTLPFPRNFLILFGLAALFMVISWIALALTREPVRQVRRIEEHRIHLWTRLGRILRRDPNFRRFLLARGLLAVGGMGMGFVTVAAVSHWDVPDGTVGYYTVALLAGQAGGNLFLGLLADRKGHKLPLLLGGLAASVAFVIAWLATSPLLYFVVFPLLGIYYSVMFVSGLMIVLEFVGPEQRATYVGITNSSVGSINLITPLVGGWLATISYDYLFVVSAAAGLLAVLLMWLRVVDPRYTSGAGDRVGVDDGLAPYPESW